MHVSQDGSVVEQDEDEAWNLIVAVSFMEGVAIGSSHFPRPGDGRREPRVTVAQPETPPIDDQAS